MALTSQSSEVVIVSEGTNEHGGYILKAKGRVFSSFMEVIAAFPDCQVDLIQATPNERLKMSHRDRVLFGGPQAVAKDVDFKLFEE